MSEDTPTPAHALAAQAALLAMLHDGARLIRHRGPLGEPLPITFTVRGDTHAAEGDGAPVDPVTVRALWGGKLLQLGPYPGDVVAPRELVLSDAGRAVHAQLQAADIGLDAAPLAPDTMEVIAAMHGGARLHRDDDHGTYTLDGHRAVSTLTGHVLVTLGYAAPTNDVTVWELSDTGRAWAATR